MDPIIKIQGVSKTFGGKKNSCKALEDISLTVNKGDICGIIGMSGAGKSTLIRCINYLEKPTEGTVLINGRDLACLSESELRIERMQMSMIFQHFNLLMQKNVLDNVCFSLEIAGVKKKEARKRAEKLLTLVGLSDKAKEYPTKLSGGQQQRVAIARAIANNPKILLCDEATSALDPENTESILNLLQEINSQLGITIVLITHEMAVVERICTRVAKLEDGKIAADEETDRYFRKEKIREVS